MWKKIKDLYDQNRHNISPAIDFVRSCVRNYTDMNEDPNIVDYVNFGFDCKESYEDTYGESNPYTYFTSNKEWTPFFTKGCHEFLVNLLIFSAGPKVRVVKTESKCQAMMVEIEDVLFGWVTEHGNPNAFYIKKGSINKVFSLLKKLFWLRFADRKVIVSIETEKLFIKADLAHDQFITFKKCDYYAEYINAFYKAEMARSILFYGMPGSGKSNLIKGITSVLNANCIRFDNLSQMTPSFVSEIIKFSDPDCIILEDVDHMESDEMNDLLDKIENFNQEKKLILATANEVSKLDNALLRPGRFDETIEIKNLDQEVLLKLVDNDQEIFELVKDFPVAFIVEVMKRVKVLGKSRALSSLQDLKDRVDNIGDTNYSLRSKSFKSDVARTGAAAFSKTGIKSK